MKGIVDWKFTNIGDLRTELFTCAFSSQLLQWCIRTKSYGVITPINTEPQFFKCRLFQTPILFPFVNSFQILTKYNSCLDHTTNKFFDTVIKR